MKYLLAPVWFLLVTLAILFHHSLQLLACLIFFLWDFKWPDDAVWNGFTRKVWKWDEDHETLENVMEVIPFKRAYLFIF